MKNEEAEMRELMMEAASEVDTGKRLGLPRNYRPWKRLSQAEEEALLQDAAADVDREEGREKKELPVFQVDGLAKEERRRQQEAATKENREADDFLERFGL